MIAALHTAGAGIRAAERMLNSTANNLANVSTPDFQQEPRPQQGPAVIPGAGNNVDVAEQMVNMTIAHLATKANVVTVRTAAETYEEILKLRPMQ